MTTTLTPEQVAARLQVKVDTIRRWCLSGKLRASKLPNGWRVTEEAIDELMKSHERGSDKS
jgi:excisionase family DNA binding protein